ncbi:hypothetical protein BRN76_22665 [Xanthomonas oryzae pv. oryzae]|nr:hypothetical protein BRN79_12970 [Xanthomonas oryzae pv. oryzae]RBA98417.1 hypothetical protein BRN75_10255 [Xanthomonas oryzae pv. oryzae]RBB02627.1 hypothetical protein BRN92_24715 [Xanthomonas oryzae pv. oryzae]RBB22756.1 hypothetical protein BRN74_15230 [Xanthomonas oryzae pv. oryzae]RBB80732.1 hypothetical protein BRN82_12230 [Xanthomonas oryzae pv. oryzae]
MSAACYAKTRAGKIPNFTGIDSPYEPPTQPDLHLRADHEEVSVLAEQVLAWLEARD